MKPLISVIVPVYNGQDYVINCIESIEKQSYSPLEIIVIDDGSTDDTRNVLEGYVSVSKYENINLLSMDDRGVSAARNFGVKSSCGEFIAFVDADDRLLPDTISNLYNALINNDADVAGCTFSKWANEGDWKKVLSNVSDSLESTLDNETCYTSKDYLSSQILNGNSRCWSKLYRRSLLKSEASSEKVSFREGLSIGEDMLFLVDLLPYVSKWVEIDYPGYGYFQNPKGAMYRPFNIHYLDQIKCWELVRDRALKIDATTESKVTRNLIMGIMLVVGKYSGLSLKERKSFRFALTECEEKLKENIKNKEAYRMLPIGYKLKTALFGVAPSLYIWLYHFHK